MEQTGQTRMPCCQSVLACMACQQPRRPQLMRIAVILGLVACRRHQPGFGLRRDCWLLARSRTIIEGPPVGIDTALHRLMIDPKSLAHRAERRILPVRQQHLRPRYPGPPAQFSTAKEPPTSPSLHHSLSLIANSTARRHPGIAQLLVSPTASEESANNPSVPPIQPATFPQVSWNRWSGWYRLLGFPLRRQIRFKIAFGWQSYV